MASRSFYDSFKVMPKETVGKLIYDLGNRQWDIPGLRTLLEEMLPKRTSLMTIKLNMCFQASGAKRCCSMPAV